MQTMTVRSVLSCLISLKIPNFSTILSFPSWRTKRRLGFDPRILRFRRCARISIHKVLLHNFTPAGFLSRSVSFSMEVKVAILPGNGDGDVYLSNWYDSVAKDLRKICNISVLLENMPDPVMAREKIWIPFMKNSLKCDEHTVIIGHSSGAQAAMRYAETHKVLGIVLVSACVTDLGIESEAVSGYYNRPWEWEKIKSNCKFIVQFGSSDDPFLPWEEQKTVAESLNADFHKFDSKGHFMYSDLPGLTKVVTDYVRKFSDN